MGVRLETLDLMPDELERAKERIRAIAFDKWRQAGSPADDSLNFWLEAEREWIEREYIPRRRDL